MKFLMIAFAVIGLSAAALLPDSATQGPNPQDIATPEPEYIDIDVPEPPKHAAAASTSSSSSSSSLAGVPAPIVRSAHSFAAPAPQPLLVSRPIQRPIASYLPPVRSFAQPAPVVNHFQQVQHVQHHQLPGHSFNHQTGYQYRRPVVIRRVYRQRF